ncbi:MAG: GtrA family protein [Candidatus Riflebacteria bacterium]|nr:GtrA family protein [Candidatus Riflebacteria bacterium]
MLPKGPADENRGSDGHKVTLRFLIAGGWNTLFGYLVFVLLDLFFTRVFSRRYLAYMSAMIMGNLLAILNAFICHKYYTFRSGVTGLGILGELARFSTTYVFTFLLSLILFPLAVETSGLDPKIVAGFFLIGTVIISFFGHSRWSFRHQDRSVPTPPAATK